MTISLINFYRYATTPTDENIFKTTPSTWYVIEGFPARYKSSYESADYSGEHPVSFERSSDSILVGDLLILHEPFHGGTAELLMDSLKSRPDSLLTLNVFRPTTNKHYFYSVPKPSMPDSFLTVIARSIFIVEAQTGGASARAGIRKGDLVLSLNNQSFGNAYEAGHILSKAGSGEVITYKVLRNNHIRHTKVTLASVGFKLSDFILFLAGIMFMVLGIFLTQYRPSLKGARLLGMSFILLGIFISTVLIEREGQFDSFATIKQILGNAGLLFGLAMLSHGKMYFPVERPKLLERRWLTFIPYVLAALFFSTLLAGWVLSFMKWSLIFKIIFGEKILIVGALAIFFFHFITRLIYYKEKSRGFTNLNRPTFIATTLSIVSIFGVLTLPESLVGGLGGYVGLPLVLVPLAYFYTITSYQLLEIHFRLRRNIQFTLISSVLVLFVSLIYVRFLIFLPTLKFGISNVILTGSSIEFVEGATTTEDGEILEKLILIVLGILLTLATIKLVRALKEFLSNKFYRATFDYKRASNELADIMATNLDMVELAEGIVRKLASLMYLKKAGILYYRQEKNCCCREIYGIDKSVWEAFCVEINDELIKTVQRYKSEARFTIDYLPNQVKSKFAEQEIRYVVPIRSKDKLVGTILIGEKMSESPFHLEDLNFLTSTAKQASIAIENAFLHEELSGQERLKHELEIARRIQLSSLPQETPSIPGLDISGVSVPAQEVGGDYFDYLNGTGEDITVVIGDVSGKGTSAALYMSKVQGIMHSLNNFDLSPRELFVRTNKVLYEDMDRRNFVTAIAANFSLNERAVRFSRTGHLPLFYYSAARNEVECIIPNGIGLGLVDQETFSKNLVEKKIKYTKNDIFLFVTDGVTEAMNRHGEEFGEERLIDILKANTSSSAYALERTLIDEVEKFARETPQHDDITIVVVRVA